MKIKIAILDEFKKKNKLKVFQTYLFLIKDYSGSIHGHQLQELADIRQLTISTIKKHLKVLEDLGYVKHPRPNWWHTVSTRDVRSSKVELPDDCLHDVSKLNTFYYATQYKYAWKVSCKINKTGNRLSDLVRDTRAKSVNRGTPGTLCNFFPVSASFVKSVSLLDFVSVKTILKHLHKAVSYGFLEMRNSIDYLCRTEGNKIKGLSFEECQSIYNDLLLDDKNRFFWKRVNTKNAYYFAIYQYLPNLVKPSF